MNTANTLDARPGGFARFVDRHALFLFALWAIWLAFEYFGFGPLSYVRLIDNGDANLPARIAASHMQWNVWAEQWVSGVDRNAQGWFVDPFILPFRVLPGWLAYGLILLAQRFLAAYFTFRLVRDHLELDALCALYSAAAFSLFVQPSMGAFGGFSLYDGFGIPGAALVLWLLGQAARCRGYRALLYPAASAAVLGLFSGPALSVFVAPLVLFWFAVVDQQRAPRFWASIVGFGLLWFLLSWPVVLGVLSNAPLSPRAGWNPNDPIFGRLVNRISLLLAYLQDNALPLLLAVLAWRFGRLRSRRFVALVAATALCLASGVLIYAVIRAMPWASIAGGLVVDRFATLLPFLCAILGGVSLDALRDHKLMLETPSRPTRVVTLATAMAAAACALLLVQSLQAKADSLNRMLSGQNYRAYYQNPELEALAAATRSSAPFRVATLASGPMAAFHPGFLWAYGLDTADGYVSLYPRRYHRFWAEALSPLLQTDPGVRGYFEGWGGRVYLFTPGGGFTSDPPVEFGRYYRLPLLSLAGVRYIVSPVPLSDPGLTLLPSGERSQQLAWEKLTRHERLSRYLHYPGIALYVYENQAALPRYFLTARTKSFADSNALLHEMAGAPTADLASTAYLEASGGDMGEIGSSPAGTVNAKTWQPDEREFVTQTTAENFLVLTTSYSPYWSAAVDGHAVKVLPVDLTFMGVQVPAGQHRIRFTYNPPLWPRRTRD